MRRHAERLSLRGRLAVLFAVCSAVLLLGSAGFLYVMLGRAMEHAVNEGLRARADDIAADIAAGSIPPHTGDAYAEILSADGAVLAASSGVRDTTRPVLSRSELGTALRHEIVVNRSVPDLDNNARLLARPEMLQSTPVAIVVGASLHTIVHTRDRVGLILAVASPLLIGAFAAGAWLVAGAALRPVRRMAEEANEISIDVRHRRLPQPPGDDEIARLGNTLNAMLDRIEDSFEREQAFVDDASHELRTPISILRAELELALLNPGDTQQVKQALQSGLEEADRLSTLAGDLLVLSRAGSHQLSIRREDVDLEALATRVSSRMSVDGGPAVEVVGRRLTVTGDPGRVEQVLVNLLANARRFARGRVRVEIGAEDGSGYLLVADDGPGFPSDILPKAFDRFTRGDHVRGRDGGGAGLGLAIVAAVVQAHGWTTEATNGPPLGGAAVRIRMPGVV